MRVKEDEDARPKVYLAAKFEKKDLARDAASLLSANDCETVSDWHKSKFESDLAATAKVRLDSAREAMKQIGKCDAFVILDAESMTGGLHFETAIALKCCKLVVLVGKPTHIFHELPEIHRVPDLKSAIYLIKGWFARKSTFES